MKYKTSTSRKVFMTCNTILMLIICVVCLLPLWHVFMASISDPAMVSKNTGFVILPLGQVSLKGYKIVAEYKSLWRGYANTIFYILVQCVITGALTLIAGYVLSRKEIRYRGALTMYLMFTMMFSGGTIPTYMVIRGLGMLDTRWSMILPTALSVFNIIIMRTGIQSIPDALVESARIDGANTAQILIKIILPLCKSTFAVIMLFTIVMKWNEWYSALLFLPQRTELYPLQMVLRQILVLNDTSTTVSSADLVDNLQLYKTLVKYCAITVSTLPILCVYPFVQKYFVTGVMIGSVKQ